MTASSTGALEALSESLVEAVESTGRSIVAVHGRHRVPSSGIVWQDGVVVTADHTLDRDENIAVTLPTGESVDATLAGRDSTTDLAALKITGGTPASKATGPKVGEIVLALGRPGKTGLSASLGVVSAVGEGWRTWSGGQIDAFVRPDLTLYPGFSGGPLVNAQGQVVGLNTSGLARSMPLTIPASTIDRVVAQLLTKGRIARGFLGVAMQPVRLPEQIKGSVSGQETGLLIVSVEPNGPAAKSGLLVGDILVSLAGSPVGDPRDVQAQLGPETVGKAIEARIVRGGEPQTVNVTVGERPRGGE